MRDIKSQLKAILDISPENLDRAIALVEDLQGKAMDRYKRLENIAPVAYVEGMDTDLFTKQIEHYNKLKLQRNYWLKAWEDYDEYASFLLSLKFASSLKKAV